MKPIVVSIGDPTGIGPIVALEALAGSEGILVGPRNLIEAAARRFGHPLPTMHDTGDAPEDLLFSGKRDPRGGRVAHAALRAAAREVIENRARALVTAPIDKNAWREAVGGRIVGHTEILAELAPRPAPGAPLMLLVCDAVRVALLTNHVPLRDAPGRITREGTVQKLRLLHEELRARFDVERPRIGVLGVNPHAGEGGELGREEVEILAPAVAEARAKGIDAEGPVPGDTAFTARARSRWDAILAATHDQGLAPFKALDDGRGVNVTLGLGFVRTSPDHGVAHDIAPAGRADAASMKAALALADRLSRGA